MNIDASRQTVLEAIVGRRSVRSFLDRPALRGTIEKTLAAASRAPSGKASIWFWSYAVAMKPAASRINPPAPPSTILRRLSLKPPFEPTALTAMHTAV